VSAEQRLRDLGIELPPPPAPAGLYRPLQRLKHARLLIVSGQVPVVDGKPASRGKVGRDITVPEAAQLARQCALQALALVRAELGTLDGIAGVARTAGYVASAEGFVDHPAVVNGASQLLIDVFGEEAGRGARIAIGVAELPYNVPVEVEFMFETSA
jgi:enamine deaminase RidA (YjgF/YER057c/UK114 family)